jgi:hypothetical protein
LSALRTNQLINWPRFIITANLSPLSAFNGF